MWWGMENGTISSVRKEINFDSSASKQEELLGSRSWYLEVTVSLRWDLDREISACQREKLLFRIEEHVLLRKKNPNNGLALISKWQIFKKILRK
jgi:hypothetical protein